ncbi:hypothetical protein B0H67DRAFT_481020 [Lasiosphaeris hirsuta]|uniref:DNA2/NAM7 helicase-like C-terminal domain-containing protein n=1 Tax=Lasiosphaeris hirsuta TaxID=260670 RepID=A0AA40AYW4_9PEZI|nr:hypothetical protein B0H67DRAFT_481020 [Lasiosphaeris hirsuta]
MGRKFETWVCGRYPDLKPSAEGTLEPIWMHTLEPDVLKVGTLKRCRGHVTLTLALLSAFVQECKVDASNIVVMTPYKPNADFANSLLKENECPILAKMPLVQTADTFHGCEGEMAVVIFRTNVHTRPGFTINENRLNAMIARQRSALLLVGDMNVTGRLMGPSAARHTKQAKIVKSAHSNDSTLTFKKNKVLRGLLLAMHKRGRFFEERRTGQ